MNAQGQLIFDKYISLPENLQQEVADFIEFLIIKYQPQKQFKKDEKGKVVNRKREKRKSNFGSARGLIIIKSDFDEPLEDFKEYM
jgi:hypothetical protein